MALIKNTSALTLNVSGVFKDIFLILWSVVVSGAVVTHLQYFGYALAIAGVSGYSAYKRAQQSQGVGAPPATIPAASDSRGAEEEAIPLADEPEGMQSEQEQEEGK